MPTESIPTEAIGVDSEATAASEPKPVEIPNEQAETVPVYATPSSRLSAPRVRYQSGTIIGEGGIVYESGAGTVRAERVEIDTVSGRVSAIGSVSVERTVENKRREIAPRAVPRRYQTETVLETLRGENFVYNARDGKGQLDNAQLRLSGFSLSTDSVVINGKQYIARNVIIRPGTGTLEDEKIYGRPPFSLRARRLTIDFCAKGGSGASVSSGATPGVPSSGNRRAANNDDPRVTAQGAGLYFKNTRILPVPTYVLQRAASGGNRDDSAFQLSPRIAFNSADRVLVTTTIRYPLGKNLRGPAVVADAGLSARIGARGGLSLEYPTAFGSFLLRGRKNDIVTTQLTNRIVLDRAPEAAYFSPAIKLFDLPRGQRVRLNVNAGVGRFDERTIDSAGNSGISATRTALDLILSTRSEERDGPYLELFALDSRYSQFGNYRRRGYEIGYYGDVLPRVRGLFSYRATDVRGATPFRFDRIEIERELRTTFDIALSPRYIIPIDLRYDLDLKKLRDERFGLLRNYKTFAYGLTYQTARRELKVEFRQGF